MTSLGETTLVSLLILGSLFFGFLVYFKDRKKRANLYFLLLSLLSGIWIGSAYSSEFFPITNPTLCIFLAKITYVTVVWWVIFLFFFSLIFPHGKQVISTKLFWIFILVGVSFSGLILFTPLLVEGIKLQPWGFDVVYGRNFGVFSTFATLLMVVAMVNFIKSYRKPKALQKEQLKYFFLGFGIFLISLIFFNVVLLTLTGIEKYYRFGNYSAIFFLGFTAYAIVTRQLFDIRVILTEILVGVIAIILFIQMMVAGPLWLKILNGVVFILFCIFGYFLIKTTIREIEMRKEVERLSNAKSEFISIASHQLRTPLTAIKGYISMMLEKTYGKSPTKMEKPLENIYASNERLIKLVNDLLNLSRLEAGKIEFNPELTSLEELVSGIIEELRINIEKKGLDIKIVKPSKPLPKIMLDQDKIRQVILNIMDNAIKYTKEGGITIKLEKFNLEEQIKISDTGEGMDEKEIQSLFQIFSRATAGTQLHTEGAGIGLYVAKQFVEMHGGKIWAESPGKGKGSTFIIQLPIHLSPKLLKSETITIINK